MFFFFSFSALVVLKGEGVLPWFPAWLQLKTEDVPPTWLHYMYLLPQHQPIGTNSHGIWELPKRLFEPLEPEYWFKILLIKTILNLQNTDLSMSGKLISLFWFYNFYVQLSQTNCFFLSLIIFNVCCLEDKLYSYPPNYLSWL